MNRRGLLFGLGAMLAMPAVVKADGLMKVRGVIMPLKYGWINPLFSNGNQIFADRYVYDIVSHQFEMTRELTYGDFLFTMNNNVPDEIRNKAVAEVARIDQKFSAHAIRKVNFTANDDWGAAIRFQPSDSFANMKVNLLSEKINKLEIPVA